jgi:hypothetical protein
MIMFVIPAQAGIHSEKPKTSSHTNTTFEKVLNLDSRFLNPKK